MKSAQPPGRASHEFGRTGMRFQCPEKVFMLSWNLGHKSAQARGGWQPGNGAASNRHWLGSSGASAHRQYQGERCGET